MNLIPIAIFTAGCAALASTLALDNPKFKQALFYALLAAFSTGAAALIATLSRDRGKWR